MKKLIVILGLVLAMAMGKEVRAEVIELELTYEYDYTQAYALLDAINEYRVENGLNALETDQTRMKNSMYRAVELNVLSGHVGPSGTVYDENIECNPTWQESLVEWKRDEAHNTYLLQKGATIAVGYVNGHCTVSIGDGKYVSIDTTKQARLTNCTVTNTIKVDTEVIKSNVPASPVEFSDWDDCDDKDEQLEMNGIPEKPAIGTTWELCRYFSFYNGDMWADAGCVSYKSSDSSVIKINDNKTYTALKAGEAKITCYYFGESVGSVTLTVKGDGTEVKKPSRVKITKLSKKRVGKKTKLTVNFKKVSGTKYQVQFSTNKKFKKSVTSKKTSKTKYSYTKAYKGKKVYVRVRAYKKVDDKTYYGKWSKTKSIKSYK